MKPSPSSQSPSSRQRSMVVAGIMSGTSADGVDVALVRITGRITGRTTGRITGPITSPITGPITARARASEAQPYPRLALLAHEAFPYPRPLRNAVLAAMNATAISAAELARLNWRLGEVYADAILQTSSLHPRLKISLIGSHGQTIYHQGRAEKYLGKPLRCTWQLGEAAIIAARCGVPVVSNFRPADMAFGGQGAPLVPLLDYVLYRNATRGRVLQNLGGIGNLTAIAPNAPLEKILAFDTGPANMLIDACMQRLYGKPYDRSGAAAKRGHAIRPVLKALLADPFFSAPPPKSAGREQFGAHYAERFLALCQKSSAATPDVIATATALTAESIALAYQRFVSPIISSTKTSSTARSTTGTSSTGTSSTGTSSTGIDYILAGGGAKNATLVQMLRERLEPLGCKLCLSDDFGLPAQAKEAMAFALLAWQTWHRLPGNVPSATGATGAAILGSITNV